MIEIRDDATGADLVDAIRYHAAKVGVAVNDLVSPLSRDPRSWISRTAAALKPRPNTIARVRALIAVDHIPPPQPYGMLAATADHLAAVSCRYDQAAASKSGSEQLRDAIAAESRARSERLAEAMVLANRPLPVARPVPVLRYAPAGEDTRPFASGREPCPRCATRGDVGCAHQRPFETAGGSA